MKKPKTPKILIVAGGSGGHILPALTLASQLKGKAQVAFVHGPSPLEKQLYSSRKEPCYIFSIGRLNKNVPFWERVCTLLCLPFALLKALRIVMRFNPSVVLGTGGALSGPLILAAWFLRKKTAIFEPNTIAGLTNRWLSPFIHTAYIVFKESEKYFKHSVRMPFPVRGGSGQTFGQTPGQAKALKVLILGGSQGSSFINKVVSEAIVLCKEESGMAFVHQCGVWDFDHLKSFYKGLKHVQVFSFIDNIFPFYEWADFVISRAGMGTLAELSFMKKAILLIPLPHSADGHQLKNATVLKNRQASLLMEEKDLNAVALKQIWQKLKEDPRQLKDLSHRLHQTKLGDSAGTMASHLLSLEIIKKNPSTRRKLFSYDIFFTF